MVTEAKVKGRKPAKAAQESKEPKAPKEKKVKEAAPVLIRTRDLVEETGIPGTEIRKLLRADFYPDGQFTRYGWDPDSEADMKELGLIRAALATYQDGKTEKKQGSVEKRNERAKTRRSSKKAELSDAEPTDGELEEGEDFEEFDEDEDED